MIHALKKFVSCLPERWQQRMKRHYFAKQIRRGVFRSEEPEFQFLEECLSPGDWVIDIGANVGHYALRMSELVKSDGRVLAFEPIPLTFELLVANCASGRFKNYTLFNLAASNFTGCVTMEVPKWKDSGSLNFYEARISPDGNAKDSYRLLAISIDAIQVPHRVGLIKIDAEGHELAVLEGTVGLLKRDYPLLIVEGTRASSFLEALGYIAEHRPGSPNYIWRHTER